MTKDVAWTLRPDWNLDDLATGLGEELRSIPREEPRRKRSSLGPEAVVPTLASVAASLIDRAGVPEYLSEAAERGGFWFSSLDFRGEIVEKAVLDWKVRIGHREPRDLDDKTIDDLLLDVLLLTGPCLQSTVTDRADRVSFLKSQREVFEISFRAENGETFDWRQYFARELAHSRRKRGR